MPDYGRKVEFGYFLVPDVSNYRGLIEVAQRVETLGLEMLGIQDHPYQPRFFDTWTLLTAVAAQTTRLRVFPDVVNLPLRPPAMLAKAAASLDVMSGGRVDIGLGAGAFQDAAVAMGAPRRTPAEAVAALDEAIQVMRLIWNGKRATYFDGQFYSLHGANPGPLPAHTIEIWIGAYRPKMLNRTGRLGDGWLPSLGYLEIDNIPAMQQQIDEGAAAAGRPPSAVKRLLNISGRITDGPDTGLLNGPVQRWVDDLTLLTVEHGFDTYIFGGMADRQLDLFAQEIVPRVREQVGRHRQANANPSTSPG
jgi:alkanesulfonate monooxygenase SsuD/methylene tetrahydromethanopterin reductase-like flavin-dependent oxidoreductase (luciferase family)